MASITIRGLDDDLKQRLRLRAVRNGRSMEDEARTILRGVAAGGDESPAAPDRVEPHASPAPPHDPEPGRRILLIIGGGIAAYKSLDLIRRLRERGAAVRCVMTEAAAQFVTPLAVASLAGEHAHIDLFDARTEFDIGHIRLARDTDVVVVAPATADLMAKM